MDPSADLAIVEHVYKIDEPINGVEKSLRQTFKNHKTIVKNAGYLARISRREGFHPLFENALKWRKKEEHKEPVEDKYLPFANRTFVIGPVVVNQEIFNTENGPTFEEDEGATTFFIGSSVAVDGKTLLDGFNTKPEPGKLIDNEKLVEMIESLLA